MTQTNDHLVLISGESGTGKSASLINLPNHERVMYLNCEAGKKLPFKNKFKTFVVTDPMQVFEAFDHTNGSKDYDIVVIDTITFLMDMYESQFVLPAANGMAAWSQYAQFFKMLMQDKVANSDKAVIFLGHTRAELDEKAMEMKVAVPIKGALKNNGIEAYFSTVVSCKKIQVKDLETADPKLLHISEEERAVGFKHVFQTRITKATTGERIRAPMGMFAPNQTYMDNDAGALLKHLEEYYA